MNHFSKTRFFCMALIILFFLPAEIFAYNPPNGCDNYFNFTNPNMLTGTSVTGGALMNVTSGSAAFNPALLAYEQRWTIDIDYTALIPSLTQDTLGHAGQFGIIIPSIYGTGAAVVNFAKMDGLNSIGVGNSCTFRGAYAKDLTDRLYVGIGLYGGFNVYNGGLFDYAVAADLGFWYMIGNLQFLKNARWAVSLTGLGKSYNTTNAGIYDSLLPNEYPSPFTLRAGFASDLCDIKNFKTGFSFDIALPKFQNLIFGAGMQFLFFDIVRLGFGWEGNVREMCVGKADYYPYASLSAKFTFGSKKKKDSNGNGKENFIEKQGWEQSEGEIGAGYRHLNNNINAVSGSATVRLGTKDTEPPKIILWDEEEKQ